MSKPETYPYKLGQVILTPDDLGCHYKATYKKLQESGHKHNKTAARRAAEAFISKHTVIPKRAAPVKGGRMVVLRGPKDVENLHSVMSETFGESETYGDYSSSD